MSRTSRLKASRLQVCGCRPCLGISRGTSNAIAASLSYENFKKSVNGSTLSMRPVDFPCASLRAWAKQIIFTTTNNRKRVTICTVKRTLVLQISMFSAKFLCSRRTCPCTPITQGARKSSKKKDEKVNSERKDYNKIWLRSMWQSRALLRCFIIRVARLQTSDGRYVYLRIGVRLGVLTTSIHPICAYADMTIGPKMCLAVYLLVLD